MSKNKPLSPSDLRIKDLEDKCDQGAVLISSLEAELKKVNKELKDTKTNLANCQRIISERSKRIKELETTIEGLKLEIDFLKTSTVSKVVQEPPVKSEEIKPEISVNKGFDLESFIKRQLRLRRDPKEKEELINPLKDLSSEDLEV